MRVALTCSPLPGLRAKESLAIARGAWLGKRPRDEVHGFPVSDGIAMPFAGSGADEVLVGARATHVELGRAGERHFAHVDGASVLFDYTEVFDGIPRPGRPSSSRLIGEDLAWAAAEGLTSVTIVLPVPGSLMDMGWGLLEALAAGPADPTALANESRAAADAPGNGQHGDRAAVLRAARAAVTSLHITVVVSREQPLLGLSGIARSWMAQGLDAVVAQTYERGFADVVAELSDAARTLPSRSLLLGTSEPDPARNIYAGAGAGTAFTLSLLGAMIHPIGQLAIGPHIAREIDEADLLVCVTGHIGEDLPSSLLVAAQAAQNAGIPVVVVYDSGGIRKGELPGLGLNGAYEIRPDRSYEMPEESAQDVADIPGRLADLMGRVATTWGWD
ncbi:MAG: glycerate kinase [Ancrocorticia sp.]